jgi:hypothetical protein
MPTSMQLPMPSWTIFEVRVRYASATETATSACRADACRAMLLEPAPPPDHLRLTRLRL